MGGPLARLRTLAFLAGVVGCLLVPLSGARAGDVDEVDEPLRRRLLEAMRDYLDPATEARWRPRGEVLDLLRRIEAEQGVRTLADVAFLRSLASRARSFQPSFAEGGWRRENGIGAVRTSRGGWRTLDAEGWQLTWSLPPTYPDERRGMPFPRPDPFPLLVSLHEEGDLVDRQGRTTPRPGEAVLVRRYPGGPSDAPYDRWIVVAPVAPRARFLEDGRIRHEVLTRVIGETWRRYHVDFDRIVVDGAEPAAALAAAYPDLFAGVVLRGGTPDPRTVPNFAHVPVFVVDDAPLARELDRAGHPEVTVGSPSEAVAWIARRRRTFVASFAWFAVSEDHRWARYVAIRSWDEREPRTLRVEVERSTEVPDTIRIDATGIGEIDLHLGDEIVDLSRPVGLVLNGRERLVEAWGEAGEGATGPPEAWFDAAFDDPPGARETMYFGRLYPVTLRGLVLGEPVLADPPPPRTPRGPEPEAVPDGRRAAEQAWLLGRPDLAEELLGPTPSGEARLLLEVRDGWWRRRPAGPAPDLDPATGLLAARRAWLAAGGVGPYPTSFAAGPDPLPVLTALIRDRQVREQSGAAWLTREGPLHELVPPPEWAPWWEEWRAFFLDRVVRTAYVGADDSDLPPAERAASEDARRLAARLAARNGVLAPLSVLLFTVGALGAGWALGRRRPPGTPPRA